MEVKVTIVNYKIVEASVRKASFVYNRQYDILCGFKVKSEEMKVMITKLFKNAFGKLFELDVDLQTGSYKYKLTDKELEVMKQLTEKVHQARRDEQTGLCVSI